MWLCVTLCISPLLCFKNGGSFSHDVSSDVPDWPIVGMRSADITFSDHLGPQVMEKGYKVQI